MTSSNWVSGFRLGCCAVIIALGGCSTLDPDGEWRGTPEARLRSCQAMFGSASFTVRDQVAISTGVAPSAPAVTAGQCPGPSASASGELTAHPAQAPEPKAGHSPRVLTRQETERVDQEVEQAYTAGKFRDALSLLEPLLDNSPHQAPRWLRKANALHRLEQFGDAAAAYRRADELASQAISQSRESLPSMVEVKSKANANLAILGIDQARRALDALGPAESDPVAAAHRRRIEAALRAVVGQTPEPAVMTPSGASIRPAAFHRTSASDSAESVVSPVRKTVPLAHGADHLRSEQVESPAPATRPSVEMIRGLTSR